MGRLPAVERDDAMSTLERSQTRKIQPPLVAGQQLDQPMFHARYEAMPEGTWAELVGGVVYMPSPLRYEHGDVDGSVGYWPFHYQRFTKGIRGGRNSTVILDRQGECKPDGHLRIPEELGRQ